MLLLRIVFRLLLFLLKFRQIVVILLIELQFHYLTDSADYHPTLEMMVTRAQESKNTSDLFFLAWWLTFHVHFAVSVNCSMLFRRYYPLHHHSFRSWRKSTWVLHIPSFRTTSRVEYPSLVFWLPTYHNFIGPHIILKSLNIAVTYAQCGIQHCQQLTTKGILPPFLKHDNTCRPVRAGWPVRSSENRDTYFWNHGRGKLHLDIHDTTVSINGTLLRYNLAGDRFSRFIPTTCMTEL